jgi:hypothetical protein
MAPMVAEPIMVDIGGPEAWSLFDAAARRYVGMSGEAFLKAWDAGDFGPDPDAHRGVMHVAMLIPLVR